MFTRRAKKGKTIVVVALLGLALLLLSGCGVATAEATGFQATPTPLPTAQQPPSNIPVYPGAKFQQTENVMFGKQPGTAWVYTVDGANVTLADVTSYYQREMSSHGWEQGMSVVPQSASGPYSATILSYYQHQRQRQPTPTPMPMPRHHGEVALIAAGVNSHANPHEIGFVIAVVK